MLLNAGLAWSADQTFPMPPDMLKLMPADPVLIVAVTSIDDLERQWLAIQEMFDDGTGEPTGLAPWINKEMHEIVDHIDMDRPLAVAMGLPNMMSGEDTPITFIIPIGAPSTTRPSWIWMKKALSISSRENTWPFPWIRPTPPRPSSLTWPWN